MKVTIPTYHECFYEIHVCCLRGTEMSCRDIKTLLSGLLQSPKDSVPRPWAGPGNSGINHQNWASQVHRTQFSSPRAVIITANVVSSLPQPQGATLEPCFLLRSLHLSHEWLSKPSQALESLSQPPMTPFLGEPSRTSLTPPVLLSLFPLVFDTLACILKPSLDTCPAHPCFSLLFLTYCSFPLSGLSSGPLLWRFSTMGEPNML